MFDHILVPLDLSDKDARAVKAATELARLHGSHLHLLHVVETLADSADGPELQEFYDNLAAKAETSLQHWEDQLSKAGVACSREVIVGRRAPEITRYASEQRCDLILLISHNVRPDQPASSIGTISHQVALLAPASVLLLR